MGEARAGLGGRGLGQAVVWMGRQFDAEAGVTFTTANLNHALQMFDQMFDLNWLLKNPREGLFLVISDDFCKAICSRRA